MMRPRSKLLICAALIVAVFIVFGRASWFGFIDYDDSDYVKYFTARPPGITVENIRWAFTTFTFSNWHPLTWISYLLDRAWFNTAPGMMHVENILLHAGSSVLLFLMLEQSTAKGWRSAIVAGLFAVHPVHIESVVWLAERKDVLSMFFLLLSWLIYVKYAEQPSALKYVLLLISYAASLMSKAMGVTFPLLLLLWDVWPLRRATLPFVTKRWSALIVEKIPLMVLSVIVSILTFAAQRAGRSLYTLNSLSIMERISNAALSYLQYIATTLLPTNLTVFYPLPKSFPFGEMIASMLLLAIITAAVLRWGRLRLYLPVGWFWFVGALVPMIGLVQVGSQAMADRYNYLPSIGLLIAIVWGMADLIGWRGAGKFILSGAASAAIVACSVLTWIQVGYWKDPPTLFNRALAVTSDNWVAHMHLGNDLAKHEKYSLAADEFVKVIEINPAYAEAYYNLGNCIYFSDPAKSIQVYKKSIELAPYDERGYLNLANALFTIGHFNEAAEQCRLALKLDPDSLQARKYLEECEGALHPH
jgi:hypothetical protein